MSTAREHAVIASELLDSTARLTEQIREAAQDPMKHTEMVAMGTYKRFNADVEHTIRLAHAHAACASALAVTEGTD